MNTGNKSLIADKHYEEMVRAEWTARSTVAAWSTWHDKQAIHTRAFTQAIIESARLKPGVCVLDLASGTGEPALSIAQYIQPGGLVTATDLSPEMLAAAEQNARSMGLVNIVFNQADAHHLPFADASFDRVTCRMGVMYFWKCRQALQEVLRVLRPDGVAVFAVWGSVEKSPFLIDSLRPFIIRKELPSLPSDAPHMMRFTKPGTLSSELTQAGFRSVCEITRMLEMAWPGPPEELWKYFYELAVPLRPYFESLPAGDRESAISEVLGAYEKNWDGRYTRMNTAINIVSGIGP